MLLNMPGLIVWIEGLWHMEEQNITYPPWIPVSQQHLRLLGNRRCVWINLNNIHMSMDVKRHANRTNQPENAQTSQKMEYICQDLTKGGVHPLDDSEPLRGAKGGHGRRPRKLHRGWEGTDAVALHQHIQERLGVDDLVLQDRHSVDSGQAQRCNPLKQR